MRPRKLRHSPPKKWHLIHWLLLTAVWIRDRRNHLEVSQTKRIPIQWRRSCTIGGKKRRKRRNESTSGEPNTRLAENMVSKSQFEALKVDLQDNDPPDTSCASTSSEFFPIAEAPQHLHRLEKVTRPPSRRRQYRVCSNLR